MKVNINNVLGNTTTCSRGKIIFVKMQGNSNTEELDNTTTIFPDESLDQIRYESCPITTHEEYDGDKEVD